MWRTALREKSMPTFVKILCRKSGGDITGTDLPIVFCHIHQRHSVGLLVV